MLNSIESISVPLFKQPVRHFEDAFYLFQNTSLHKTLHMEMRMIYTKINTNVNTFLYEWITHTQGM